jgi:hypothetical protein
MSDDLTCSIPQSLTSVVFPSSTSLKNVNDTLLAGLEGEAPTRTTKAWDDFIRKSIQNSLDAMAMRVPLRNCSIKVVCDSGEILSPKLES